MSGQGVYSFLRLRPSTDSTQPDSFLRTSETTALDVNSSTTHHFTHVFETNCDQKTVYDKTVGEYVSQFLSGTSVVALTWGPTNAGKTYTMCGDSGHPGLLPRVCTVIGNSLSELLATPNASFPLMKCSYVEVYNEHIYDLLSTANATATATSTAGGGGSKHTRPSSLKLKVETDRNGETHIRGVEELVIKTNEELFKAVEVGQTRRKMESTVCNRDSSRSHCVLTLTLHFDSKHCSRLTLVDLAGSEGVRKTRHPVGMRLAEANHINKSLGVLGRCFDALNKGGHVPFRSSKLTMLLAPFFTGSAVVLLIVSVNPDPASASENVNALKYAAMASEMSIKSKIDTGKPVLTTVEEDSDGASHAQSRHAIVNEVRELMASALEEAQSLARDLAQTERELCGNETPFLLAEDIDSERKQSSSSNKRAKRSPRDSSSLSSQTLSSPSETVSLLRAQLQQMTQERDEHKRRAAYVSAQLENPFLVVASTEGRALMAEGAMFTRVFLRDTQIIQVSSTPVFVFLKPRGPIGELHWMTADDLNGNVNAFNLMTREIKTDSLPLHLVSDVHMGKCTKSLKSKFAAGFPNNCCFSVSSTATGQILNLVAPSPERAFTWLFGINCLLTRLGKGVRVEDDDLLSPRKKHANHTEEAL